MLVTTFVVLHYKPGYECYWPDENEKAETDNINSKI